jgi:sensor histidine kinase regulating citrate/malate metabolism
MIDFAGISMLYAHLLQCSEAKTRRELEAVQNVLQSQYQQYKQWRESINLINYKYHDLKHQIEFLRNEQDANRRNDFLNQMEDEIKTYELQNKTGNTVVDTVLTGKNLYCDKHGITLTSVVDGGLLEFMNAMDICSIFGNALDNAIESELKIPNKEKRLIHVTVSQQKNFLMIRFENYFEGDLKYSEGILATTKKEKGFHGYGIKSIKYTVNKYGGAVGITAENNWFDLKILIPIQ